MCVCVCVRDQVLKRFRRVVTIRASPLSSSLSFFRHMGFPQGAIQVEASKAIYAKPLHKSIYPTTIF